MRCLSSKTPLHRCPSLSLPCVRRYTFLQTQGDDSILQAQLRIKVAIESHNNLAVTLVAMHAALLAATAVAGVW